MQVYRAEDGESFQVPETLRDIERLGSLELFLHNVTGVDPASVLAYLSDGRRLRDENIRELAGAPDQSIFVFNKHYLDYELEDVLHTLRVDPALRPEVAIGDLRHIDVLNDTGIAHHDYIAHLLDTIHVQHDALRIASTSLDLHVLSISDAFETFAGGGRRELEKQTHLLRGLELDLEVIAKIQIHPEFLSAAARKAMESGEKARTLGDYVSNVKMRQVGEACAKTHNELRRRFETAEESVTRLSSGADDVRSSIVNSGLVEEADSCMIRAQEAVERITEMATQLREPRKDEAELWTELRRDDIALRDEVQLIVDIKNKSTALCMKALRRISHLNNDLMFLPPALSALQSDLRAKTNFAHIQRLHNMLYAYGATLVEIVRRKEFSRFFTQRAQTIAEIMAKLSSSERKRRQIYRGEVHGQLPFDTKGMEDSVPAMEITSTGVGNINYSIERGDLISLLDEIDKIEQAHRTADGVEAFGHNPLQETRGALEKLINRMDTLETTFDKMAEKTIFSASRVSLPRRQATDHTDDEFQEVVEQLHELQDVRGERERRFDEDRQSLEGEIVRLHQELHELRTQRESEATAHRSLNERHTELLTDLEGQRKVLADAEARAIEQIEISNGLRQELAQTTSDLEEARRVEAQTAETATTLLADQAVILQDLESAREKGQDLQAQVIAARAEVEQANQVLKEAKEEKDRQLRAQTSEADRMLRDIIAEADGDRAVLEHQCFEMRAALDVTERELKQSRSELDISNADAAGLREELQRVEHELGEVRHGESTLRSDLRAAQSALARCRTRLEDSEQLARDLLQVATAFRKSQTKAYAAAQSTSLSSSKSLANLADSVPSLKPFVEPSPIDPEDPAGGLRILKEYDLTAFNDAIVKTGSTIRKWQKQCKEYRDRAKGKISFRNFAKGDLALFLPTRNSVSKPWAAFNVSFPHYFLQATGNLAEQLSSREWIVARIASIAERVADNRDPDSNPYGLSDGTKFYMLQVEDWTQSSPNRRKTSPPKPNPTQSVQEVPSTPGLNGAESATVPPPPPSAQPPTPTLRHLLGPRQRTHSAPAPQPSSLSRLLARAPPSIEEVKERSSPSPPRLSPSRPSSPLAAPPNSRHASSSPSPSRPTSPLVSPPLVRASSPLAGASHSQPSSPLAGPSYARASPPLSGSPRISPLAGPSNPRSPSPITLPLTGASPSRASPKSATPPIRAGSRRSSLSSHPSSVFSGGRHAFTSSSPAKAVATTALSGGSGTGVSPPINDSLSSRSQSREELPIREIATPSPEGSPSEGMSSVLLSRRRTTSASVQGPNRSSPLSSPPELHPQPASSGMLARNLASSWGAAFGRKRTTRHSTGASGSSARNTDSTVMERSRASEILKRFDDILPREGGSR